MHVPVNISELGAAGVNRFLHRNGNITILFCATMFPAAQWSAENFMPVYNRFILVDKHKIALYLPTVLVSGSLVYSTSCSSERIIACRGSEYKEQYQCILGLGEGSRHICTTKYA